MIHISKKRKKQTTTPCDQMINYVNIPVHVTVRQCPTVPWAQCIYCGPFVFFSILLPLLMPAEVKLENATEQAALLRQSSTSDWVA